MDNELQHFSNEDKNNVIHLAVDFALALRTHETARDSPEHVQTDRTRASRQQVLCFTHHEVEGNTTECTDGKGQSGNKYAVTSGNSKHKTQNRVRENERGPGNLIPLSSSIAQCLGTELPSSNAATAECVLQGAESE